MKTKTHRLLSIAVLSALLAAGAAAHAETFEDSFMGRLGEGWSWIRENPAGWRVTERGLEIRIEPGNMWGPENSARNLLVRPLPKSTEGETEISLTVENRPTEQYEQVDLVWYYNDSHMVKIGQERVDGQLTIVMGREEADRTRTIAIIPISAASVRLRLTVAGNRIRGEFQPAGAEAWTRAGECDLPGKGPAKAAIQCYQGPAKAEHWARLTQFLLVSRSASPSR